MMQPAEFVRTMLPHGTTAQVTDPHEIANVCGRSVDDIGACGCGCAGNTIQRNLIKGTLNRKKIGRKKLEYRVSVKKMGRKDYHAYGQEIDYEGSIPAIGFYLDNRTGDQCERGRNCLN